MISGSYVLASLLALNGPFFPASLIVRQPQADTRRCVIGASTPQSDCALIGSQWVVTTAAAVAAARPLDGRIRVRIGDEEFAVDQLIYHPKWHGGVKYDVTLVRLADRVPGFPMLPPPGEFAIHVERVVQHALPQRDWVAQTTGPASLWNASTTISSASKQSAFLTRVRSIVGWMGGSSND